MGEISRRGNNPAKNWVGSGQVKIGSRAFFIGIPMLCRDRGAKIFCPWAFRGLILQDFLPVSKGKSRTITTFPYFLAKTGEDRESQSSSSLS